MGNELSNLIIKRIYSASTMYTEENAVISRKNRPSWAVVIKYEGETVYFSNNKKYISNINNMVILPKGCNYEWRCLKSGHYAIIEFEGNFSADKIYSFKVSNPDKILHIFKDIEYKRIKKASLYEMESIKDTYSIILSLLSYLKKEYLPSSKEQKLSPVFEYITKNYNKKITNEKLAEICGLSTVYFRKLFTAVYGISPINHVKELKIKKAKEMLRSDYGSITDIAIFLGYKNIYDFSRDFKKQTGISPSKFIV